MALRLRWLAGETNLYFLAGQRKEALRHLLSAFEEAPMLYRVCRLTLRGALVLSALLALGGSSGLLAQQSPTKIIIDAPF